MCGQLAVWLAKKCLKKKIKVKVFGKFLSTCQSKSSNAISGYNNEVLFIKVLSKKNIQICMKWKILIKH